MWCLTGGLLVHKMWTAGGWPVDARGTFRVAAAARWAIAWLSCPQAAKDSVVRACLLPLLLTR
jgi:hypothetical protein